MTSREDPRSQAERWAQEGKRLPAAEAFLALGLRERARSLVSALLQEAPDRPDLLLLHGRILALGGDHEAAATVLRRVCQQGGASAEAHHELARSLATLGELDAALHHLGEALHLDPTRLSAYETTAQLLWSLDKPRAAVEFLRRAVASLPASELYLLLARAAVVAQDGLTAQQAIRWLRAHTEPSAARELELGSLHLALGELPQAEADFAVAAELAPDSPAVAHALATLCLERHQREEAEVHFRRALTLDATHWPAMNDLGLLLLTQGRTAEAVRILRRAVSQQPGEAASHLNLALALLAAGARVAARHHARAALSLAGDSELAAQAGDLVRQIG
ncbi:MAG: tetratricopeptide repeat protein [Myxococcota bacterium]|jgi:Flp pilus assembly protein TadD|nr:tetratricopeptide repeat protein [Myxococcota bacterium]